MGKIHYTLFLRNYFRFAEDTIHLKDLIHVYDDFIYCFSVNVVTLCQISVLEL